MAEDGKLLSEEERNTMRPVVDSEVKKDIVSYAQLPEKYEAGTMATAEVVAFSESIKLVEKIQN